MNYELLTPVVRYCFYTLIEACSKLILNFYVAEKTQVRKTNIFCSIADTGSGSWIPDPGSQLHIRIQDGKKFRVRILLVCISCTYLPVFFLHPCLSFCTPLPIFQPLFASPPPPTLPVFLVPVFCFFSPPLLVFIRPFVCHFTPSFCMSFPTPLSDSLFPIACLIIPPSCLFTATCLYFWHPLECLSLQPRACLFCTLLPVFYTTLLPAFFSPIACLFSPLIACFFMPPACLFSPLIARHVLSLCLFFSIRCLSFYAPLLVFLDSLACLCP
jgi:hypothetical protein